MPSLSTMMSVQTEVVMMDELLERVASGRLRVPVFNRPFVWRPEQMLELFDSIERGYPVGSLLVWQTEDTVASLEQIGDIAIPDPEPGTSVSYILDGHQRVSTLFGCLFRASEEVLGSDAKEWRWRIYRDLRGGDTHAVYRHQTRAGETPAYLLPLHSVRKTLDFLAFSRAVMEREDSATAEALVEQAELVAQRIKSYKIALSHLVGGNLSQAVEVFSRINQSGQKITSDQMVSALTFRDHGQVTLAERIDHIVSQIGDMGFGEPRRETIFRAVLAIAGEQDVMAPDWNAVVRRVDGKVATAAEETVVAMAAATGFLQREIKVPLFKFLPYAHQLMLLTVFFHHRKSPSSAQLATLRRWFWNTSWTEAFASANSTAVRRALDEMIAFANGHGKLEPRSTVVEPLPEKFNLNSARTRAYLIWELAVFPDRLDPAGDPIRTDQLLATSDSTLFRHVVDRDYRPANRVILPTRNGTSVRSALINLAPEHRSRVLESHGIPVAAWQSLVDGDSNGFVAQRTEFLAKCLGPFLAELGLTPSAELVGSSEPDTE
ncbi:hypothetical protein F4553_002101 [Allocatelliglobosispora scoriae]|uniref:GmrSD restriction endonucleases N-terminal domain-containing protein n=1 Tax=Allocatelliglobosispora scoriae TaxID=643052 RepID=A0A841BPP6_9ACTN|nr:DUF262 domain-containing protein [Allocatelliglobosispora scoriae]MBB5868722.1 hypothetical protein [Allocatelliglobosispora scoriae]